MKFASLKIQHPTTYQVEKVLDVEEKGEELKVEDWFAFSEEREATQWLMGELSDQEKWN